MSRESMKDQGSSGILVTGFAILAVVISLGFLSLFNDHFLVPLAVVTLLCPPVWTYFSARATGVEGAFYWGLLALFANVIGMIFYYLYYEGFSLKERLTCEECGVSAENNWNYCPFCRSPLRE